MSRRDPPNYYSRFGSAPYATESEQKKAGWELIAYVVLAPTVGNIDATRADEANEVSDDNNPPPLPVGQANADQPS